MDCEQARAALYNKARGAPPAPGDDTGADVDEHLATCPACRERLARLAGAVLAAPGSDLPCAECRSRLHEYVLAELDGADMPARLAAVAEHAAECPDCRLDLAAARSGVEVALKDVPAARTTAARRLAYGAALIAAAGLLLLVGRYLATAPGGSPDASIAPAALVTDAPSPTTSPSITASPSTTASPTSTSTATGTPTTTPTPVPSPQPTATPHPPTATSRPAPPSPSEAEDEPEESPTTTQAADEPTVDYTPETQPAPTRPPIPTRAATAAGSAGDAP